MEDYLQYMKTLRTQMNEIEDQATKLSVEEQMQLTTIQNLEKDLDSVKNEIQRLKEEIDLITKEKGQICFTILGNQRKMTTLDSDSSTLSQTLNLIQKEKGILSAKLAEKSSAYYLKTLEEMTKQLKEQQDWITANNHGSCIGEISLVADLEDEIGNKNKEIEGSEGNIMGELIKKLDASKGDFDRMKSLKGNLVLQNSKMKQSLKQVKDKMDSFNPELKEMEYKMLEEELHALLSDKGGLIEYSESLELQIMQAKDLLFTVNCSCGMEYEAGLDPEA